MSQTNRCHWIAFLCLMSLGCAVRRERAADLQHTPGEVVHTAQYSKFSPWTEARENELTDLLGISIEDKDLASLQMPQVVQFQSQIDKLHAVIVQGAGKNIPKPRIILHGSNKSANGMVLPVSNCLPIILKWDDKLPMGNEENVLYPVRGQSAPIQLIGRFDMVKCRKRMLENLSDSEVTALVADVLGFNVKCLTTKMGDSGKQVTNIDKNCMDAVTGRGNPNPFLAALGFKGAMPFGGGGPLVVPSTANWIFMTPAVLALPEDQALALIFHELAHYYRAHYSYGTGIDYFYLLDADRNENRAPTPLASSHPLYQLGLELKGVVFQSSIAPEDLARLKRAKEGRLGFYTIEQEADELALEYLKTMGKRPGSLADALLSLLKDGEAIPSLYPEDLVPGYKACAAFKAAGFPEFVGVGLYDDPHHSVCYRIYNIYREIKVHGY